MQRESTEWADFIWNDAGTDNLTRFLLVGDSICRGYRSFVQKKLRAIDTKFTVDTYSGSRGIDDPIFFAELELMLGKTNGYRYRAVHFNNGLHGKHLSIEEYTAGLEKAMQMIHEYQPEAKIILATSTPVTLEDLPGVLDPDENRIPVTRNDAVRDTAEKHGFEVNDLYSEVINNEACVQLDGVHFNEEGYEILADAVVNMLIK